MTTTATLERTMEQRVIGSRNDSNAAPVDDYLEFFDGFPGVINFPTLPPDSQSILGTSSSSDVNSVPFAYRDARVRNEMPVTSADEATTCIPRLLPARRQLAQLAGGASGLFQRSEIWEASIRLQRHGKASAR